MRVKLYAMISIKSYIWTQIRFSFGNLFSIPIGTALLFGFTEYLHIWYIASSLLSMCCTTVINFFINVALGVIKLEHKSNKIKRYA